MKISILTLFPEMFDGPFKKSIIKRAIDNNIVAVSYINIRDFATDRYKSVDGHPYGGGPGMILRVDVIHRALQSIPKGHVVLLDAGGTRYTQAHARELFTYDHLILICGHYEGVDARVRAFIDEELSIGDYVVTGGEIPAMVVVDSVVRLLPRVLKKEAATIDESFTGSLLEHPQYTEPRIYNGLKVPDVIVSGNHAKILEWQKKRAIEKTNRRING